MKSLLNNATKTAGMSFDATNELAAERKKEKEREEEGEKIH